jgi:uncharacterized protein
MYKYVYYGKMEFEWDDSKEKLNIKKHKVNFSEAVDSFYDANGFQLDDVTHSKDEKRSYWVGKTKTGRILTTYYTQRGPKVRIIGSAEWRRFRRLYETTQNERSKIQ